MIIAQQFSAGIRAVSRQSVREADGWIDQQLVQSSATRTRRSNPSAPFMLLRRCTVRSGPPDHGRVL